jgi:hypothetical protein
LAIVVIVDFREIDTLSVARATFVARPPATDLGLSQSNETVEPAGVRPPFGRVLLFDRKEKNNRPSPIKNHATQMGSVAFYCVD